MKDMLLHKATLQQIEDFITNPSHAVLITGALGSGKAQLATQLSSRLLNLDLEKLSNYPYFTHLARPEDKKDISIESIRGLNKLLKLKTSGENKIRRVILIEDAQDLNEEASNALLKMLEEPAPDCVFILTTTSIHSLLPTISSRAQQLQVRPIGLEQSLKSLKNDYSDKDIESAWRLSQGATGLMIAILQGDKSHPLKMAIDEAKDYLRKDTYERTLLNDPLSKNKKQLALLLEALAKLLGAVQSAGINNGKESQQRKLLASRKLIIKLQNALDANGSPKLIALELSLNLI